jgi:hypothetical protein
MTFLLPINACSKQMSSINQFFSPLITLFIFITYTPSDNITLTASRYN